MFHVVKSVPATRLLFLLSLFLLLLLSVTSAGAITQPQSYIVLMRESPLVTYEAGVESFQAENVEQQAAALRASHEASLKEAGLSPADKLYSYTYTLNGYAALMTPAEAEAVARQAEVAYVFEDEMRYLQTDNSPDFLGLTDRGGAWAKGYDGEGVVVGVIDSGIWPEHPSFADDGSYNEPPVELEDTAENPACNFGDTAHNPADAPFTCNNKLIGAREFLHTYKALTGLTPREYDSARDDNGHGTHTASTAAGNWGVQATIFGIDRGQVSGIAPRAHIVAYKALGALGGYTSDLAAAIDQAVADGVHVINYSIGGGPRLATADTIAFLFAADAGVFVASSNGNSGPGAYTGGGPASVPWLTAVGASTQDRTFEGSVESSDGWEFFGASITGGTDELPLVDAADAGSALCIPGELDPTVVAGTIVLCERGLIARVDKSRAVYEAGGAGMVLFNTSDAQALVTDNHFVPSVHVNYTAGITIKNYIATTANPTAKINGGVAVPIPAPWMADFSSRGPNPVAEDIIKPDVTAPGVNILAGNTPTPQLGRPGELFQSISGTSMSSPHVAGVFALIKQAHPDWSAAMAKSAVMTTAYQDVMKEDGVTPADPFDMGAGHLDPGGPVGRKGSVFNPGLVYDAGFLDYLGFLCTAQPGVVSPATCAVLPSLGIPLDPSDLNLPSIGIAELVGSQTVQRTVTMVGKRGTFRATVEAPPGFTVDVHPRVISLAEGESATYHVTITNDGTAAIGEWAFGSLTWGAGYNVRIPIAVRAVEFEAPTEVFGSGVEGSTSFDVKFGYTGDYSAAAHGLEPATLTEDAVYQDPDQSFDPNDGYSNAHEFDLSGAAYFRVAIPPEATVPGADLDVFVYDPTDTLVAASTLAGTDEQVDILLPMDGTWTVYVHGWLAPETPTPYTMYSWIISATPGGNLNIDSAPDQAVIGAVETITVSWSGLAPDMRYLGAVSHTGPNGLMGLTLVNVDTSEP
jgi:subtilisin family serine protease